MDTLKNLALVDEMVSQMFLVESMNCNHIRIEVDVAGHARNGQLLPAAHSLAGSRRRQRQKAMKTA